MFERLRKVISNRPTPVKDKIQEVAAKGFAAMVIAAFIGCVLAVLVTKGCR